MNHSDPTSFWIFGLIGALILLIVVWSILHAKKRTRDLAAAGQQLGFTFMSDAWKGPVLNSQHKTCLLQRTRGRFKNVMVGSAGGLQAIVFDYTYPMGKSTVTQTLASFSDKIQLP